MIKDCFRDTSIHDKKSTIITRDLLLPETADFICEMILNYIIENKQ